MVQANEGRLCQVSKSTSTNKAAVIVNCEWKRVQGTGDVELENIGVLQKITVKVHIACVQVFANGMAQDVDASALGIVPSVVRCRERRAEQLEAEFVNESLRFPGAVIKSANEVALVANLVCHGCG